MIDFIILHIKTISLTITQITLIKGHQPSHDVQPYVLQNNGANAELKLEKKKKKNSNHMRWIDVN